MIILGALLFAVMLITIGSDSLLLREEETITQDIRKTEYPENGAEFSTKTRSNNWFTVTVDSLRDCGRYTSIAIDQSNHPHISYNGWTNTDLKYANWNGSAWNRQVLDDGGFTGTGIALMPGSDAPHMSYLSSGTLRHMYFNNGTGQWVNETVDQGNVGQNSSIAIDDRGWIHISYFDSTNQDLKYAKWDQMQWMPATIDGAGAANVGMHTSIAVENTIYKYAHIGYYNVGGQRPKYATETGVAWFDASVDTAPKGEYVSLALMAGYLPMMTYYDAGNADLMMAWDDLGLWNRSAVDQTGDVGKFSSLAFDSNNHTHISYYDATNGDLKYASNAGGSLQIEVVDSTGDVGLYTSIAIDGNDVPHISYYDKTNGDLKYATIDNEKPSLDEDLTDAQASTGDPFKFKIKASDNFGIADVHINWTQGNDSFNETLQFVDDAWERAITVPNHDARDLRYRIYIKDAAGNVWISNQETRDVTDDEDPSLVDDLSPRRGYTGDDYTFNIQANDNVDVDSVIIDWAHGDVGGSLELNRSRAESSWAGDIVLDEFFGDNLTYFIHIKDRQGRTFDTPEIKVPVEDNDPPVFPGFDSVSTEPRTGENTTIKVECRDNLEMKKVILEYMFNGENENNTEQMEPLGNDMWEIHLDIPADARELDYHFIGKDMANHEVTYGPRHFDVIDSIAPVAKTGGNITANKGDLVVFDATNSSDNRGITSYTWTFDYDGSPVELEGITANWTFVLPGTYEVTLTVVDEGNQTAEETITVHILDRVTLKAKAEVNGEPIGDGGSFQVARGTLVRFVAGNSTGDIANYHWHGEGMVIGLDKDGEVVEHTFITKGNYTITLTVTDHDGETDSISFSIMVTAGSADDKDKPKASLSADGNQIGREQEYKIEKGQKITFDASDSSDNVGIVNFTWTIQKIDGSFLDLYGRTVEFVFTKAGRISVTLTVRDEAGNEDSLDFIIVVAPDGMEDTENPVAKIMVDGRPVKEDGTFKIDKGHAPNFNAGESTDDIEVESYFWAIRESGNSFNSSDTEMAYQFNDAGVFTVTLTVTDRSGNTGSLSIRIMVMESVGPILNERGEPVMGAEVTFHIGDEPYSALTDKDGIAKFEVSIPKDTPMEAKKGDTIVKWNNGEGAPELRSEDDTGASEAWLCVIGVLGLIVVIILIVMILVTRKKQKAARGKISSLEKELEKEEMLEEIGKAVQGKPAKKGEPGKKETKEGKPKKGPKAKKEPKGKKISKKEEPDREVEYEEYEEEEDAEEWDYGDDELEELGLPPPPDDLIEALPALELEEVHSAIKNIIPGYIITGKLGAGGFATVYKAINKDGVPVAIKLPKFLDETIDSSVLNKFQAEADIWKKLKHKNIVTFLDSNIRPVPYMTIELMEGGNLGGLLKDHRLPVEDAKPLMLQILDGLSYAHRMASVHRDIKPENILFTKDGVPKIADWGIGKFMASESVSQSIGTKGTFLYSAPEQFDKDTYGQVDWSTDIFQIGIVFYEMLTGKNPFKADELAAVMGLILTRQPKPPSSLNPDVSPELDEIIMKCIEKKKEDRWRSTDVLYSKLKEMEKRKMVNTKKYRRSLERALTDGVISDDEEIMLGELREHMGITDSEHESLVEEILK